VDRGRIEAFLETFISLAAGTTTIGLLAVADRSGLSTHLGEVGGGTSAELATGAGLDERYVQEIMSGLAAAGVVEYDPDSERFELPPEHALFIYDEASPYFMGGFLDMLPAVLSHVDGVAEATKNGGGVPFDAFGEIIVRGIDRGNTPSQTAFLIDRWLPAIPGLIPALERGARLADVGCGSGTAAILMARTYPNSWVDGFDVSTEALQVARDRAAGLDNIAFAESEIAKIPTEEPYRLITSFDVIHDLADPAAGLRRIREALAEDGQYLMMEPKAGSRLEDNLNSRGALLYGISTLHCMTQSLARGGAGLGSAWGRERAEQMAADAGFGSFRRLDDITNKFSAFYLLTQ
jgi:SAM-dependent methyltransferase